MMILGSWFGAWGTVQFHSVWAGVLTGILGGAAGGLLHALATVTFNVDHIVSGVAINIVALGVTPYLSGFTFAHMAGAGQTQSPTLPEVTEVSLPLVDRLSGLEAKHWFVISDIAGVLRGVFTEVSVLTVLAVLLVPLTYFVLWRTPFGLRLRSCGENPHAAETLGVNVYRYKYYGVVISGALAGLGGAFLSMVAANIYREGQTAGRGFIGLATMIFGNWRPGGLAAGALLFGYTDSLQLRGGSPSVHALLLLIAALLLAVAILQYVRGGVIVGSVSAALAVTVGLWWLLTGKDAIPVEFVLALPYVTTLVVLALASQRLRPPAADGLPYRKGGG
jgi:simple sugar transport system permease protein